MLSNIAARPDFIAYNWVYRNDLSREKYAVIFIMPCLWDGQSVPRRKWICVGKIFKLFIFENFIPKGGCLMDKRHFIFDIDRTLINTEKAIIKGLQELLLEVKGVPYEPGAALFLPGDPRPHYS